MDLHNTALVMAGVVGSTVAIVHGFIMQRLIVRPIHELTVDQLPSTIRRLVAGLLHFTTINWFISGLGLLIATYSFGREARLATEFLVGSSYLFGALVNLWATRGCHWDGSSMPLRSYLSSMVLASQAVERGNRLTTAKRSG